LCPKKQFSFSALLIFTELPQVIHHFAHRVRTFFHPERFQGWGKQHTYFEGWYFKLVDPSGQRKLAIIPGIALDDKGERHSFVQVLDGNKKIARYHRFPFESFRPSVSDFSVSIQGSFFSDRQIDLHLEGCQGQLHFDQQVPWPKPFYSPGIMGPFAFVPFMECYHGIVSMDHQLKGKLVLDEGEEVDFTGGRGYIEKDWGRSFPSAYIWMQCNHFSQVGTSLKCSVARIPWMGSAFTGFIAGLWWEGRLHRFTTYNRSRLIRSVAHLDKVELVLHNPSFRLMIEVERDHPTALASPIMGKMEGRIDESMNGITRIRLFDRRNSKLLYEDTGGPTALEVAGDIPAITVA
jgi:hypothetical protein